MLPPRDDLNFLLFDWLNAQNLTDIPQFAHADADTMQAMLDVTNERVRHWCEGHAEDLQGWPAKSRRKRKKILQNLVSEVRYSEVLGMLHGGGVESEMLRALSAEMELLFREQLRSLVMAIAAAAARAA